MLDFEKVEKLRARANISFEEAKKALEETDGDMLEAIINLEKQNRIKAPEAGGYYNSQADNQGADEHGRGNARDNGKARAKDSTFGEQVTAFFRWCGRVIHKGNINHFEILKDGSRIMMLPLTVLALLLLFAFWIVVPLIILGLFFGYRYQFKGPDLEKPEVNRAIENVSNATVRAVDSVVSAVDHLAKDTKKNKGEGNGADSDH